VLAVFASARPRVGLPPGPELNRHPVAGAVLCGGQSRRFGSDKALADAGGIPLGRRVIDAMADAGVDPIVAVGGTAGSALGVVSIADKYPGQGPLAALATVLRWAGAGRVLVAPCDLPLIVGSDFECLINAGDDDEIVVANAEGRVQPSVGCWPAIYGADISALVAAGRRRWMDGLEVGPWRSVSLDDRALYDADTPERLAALLNMGPRHQN